MNLSLFHHVFGREPRPTHLLTRAVILRGLGVVYLIAFVSFWVQAMGLIGSGGILPAADLLASLDSLGFTKYFRGPTLLWLGRSDGAIHAVCAIGCVAAAAMIAGAAPILACTVAWGCYLSLVTVGQVFMGYQWDALLTEAGLLAIFLAPVGWWRPGLAASSPPARVVIWLFRLLALRLMFSSGAVKFVSGDPTWANLTAMQFHYWTQPIPNPLAWYFDKLPAAMHKVEVVLMFAVELAAPWGMFGPRVARRVSFVAMSSLMTMIMLTGNYTFFNLLSLVLFASVLDDGDWRWWLRVRQAAAEQPVCGPMGECSRWRWLAHGPLVAVVAVLTVFHMTNLISGWVGRPVAWPRPVYNAYAAVAPWHITNHYGLFAVMTTTRPEILVQGSHDGKEWQVYEFPWKPGDLARMPPQVAPHQPRLDWQMWFEALGRGPDYWFARFALRLLENAPDVTALLEHNPFADRPPRYIRAVMYEYRFTTVQEHAATGRRWERTVKREFLPVVDKPTLERALQNARR